MKRFFFFLILLISAVTLTGCSTKIEKLQGLLDQSKESLQTTNERLEKLREKRNEVEADFDKYISESGKTREEVEAELVKEKSQWGNQPWFQKIKVTWNLLNKCNDFIEILTKQKERLDSNIFSLKAMIESAKIDDEFKKSYLQGDDPELDKAIAEYEVDIKIQPIPLLTDESSGASNQYTIIVVSIVSALIVIILIWLICVKASKPKSSAKSLRKKANSLSVNETNRVLVDEADPLLANDAIQESAELEHKDLDGIKIPGLKLTSINDLPAFPNFEENVQPPAAPEQKGVFNRVKNECNEIIENAQKEAAEQLNSKRPEAACVCWLETIKKINEKIDHASRYIFSVDFETIRNDLYTCQNDTLHVMSKPYQRTLAQCVKNMESKVPDWDAISELLEGICRVKPDLSLSEKDTLRILMASICFYLDYSIKQNDEDAKANSQRLETIIGRCYKTFFIPGDRKIYIVNGVEFPFRWCPAGTFTMGEERRYRDETQHEVTLTKGFWMMETQVTQKQWKAIMGNNPSSFIGDDLSVVCVSWNDCQDFCMKCAQLGLSVQLPTEAQWEYACRAGTTGAYAGNLDEMAWYTSNSNGYIYPVGKKKPNAWGLYDMHGYVWEWCQDWYGDYPSGSVTDPTGPTSGSFRVNRGGSWNCGAGYCRSAYRGYAKPDIQDNSLGFRILKGY